MGSRPTVFVVTTLFGCPALFDVMHMAGDK